MVDGLLWAIQVQCGEGNRVGIVSTHEQEKMQEVLDKLEAIF